MFFLGAVLALTAFVVITAVLIGLRRVVLDEEKVEEQMRAPGAHTLDFEVPSGMDPVDLEFALSRAHFSSLTRFDGGTERVTVACGEQDRERVRDVLEHVHAVGAARPDEYLGHVRFADEVDGTSEPRTSGDPVGITTAAEPAAEPFAYNVGKHEKRYLISMGIRTLCFAAAILSIGHWFLWLFVAGAIVLPYFAVSEAN